MIKILGHVVAPLHKTDAPLIPIVCDIFCMLAKHIIGEFDPKITLRCARYILGVKKVFAPRKPSK
jgi:hypothetical protein